MTGEQRLHSYVRGVLANFEGCHSHHRVRSESRLRAEQSWLVRKEIVTGHCAGNPAKERRGHHRTFIGRRVDPAPASYTTIVDVRTIYIYLQVLTCQIVGRICNEARGRKAPEDLYGSS